jgi:hypothetical protein
MGTHISFLELVRGTPPKQMNLACLERPFEGLTWPLKGLIRPLKDLTRPFKSLIRLLSTN